MLLHDLVFIIPDFLFISHISLLLLIAVINQNFLNTKHTLSTMGDLSIIGLVFIFFLNLNKLHMQSIIKYGNNVFNTDVTFFISNFLLQESLHVNVFKIILLFISIIIFVTSKYYYNSKVSLPFEVPIIVLFSLFGILVVISTTDLLLLYLALELQSLSIYALVTSKYRTSTATEAGLKYFILGSFISGFMLYAISILYLITGTTHINNIYLYLMNNNTSPTIILAITMLIIGFLFKLSAAPFHNWTPDVFEGAPTSVTLFISTVPKLAILYVIINIYYVIFHNTVNYWTYLFLIAGIFSLLIGALGGLQQSKIKRLLAFSTINNMGYILLGLSIGTKESIEVIIFYILIYILLTIGFFSVLISVIKGKSNTEIVYINELNIVMEKNRMFGFILALNIFSLIGVPPLIGFFSKFYLITLLLQENLVFYAVVAVIISVISCFYYLRLVKVLFINKANFTESLKPVSESIIFIIYIVTCLNILLCFNIDYILRVSHLLVLSIYS